MVFTDMNQQLKRDHLTSMFEVFVCNTKKDLGPLCPNWFEELTAKALRKDDADMGEVMVSGPSCHEDVAFKLPETKAEMFVASQTSTPKLLRKPSSLSFPELLKEGTPSSARIFSLTESNPCIFGSAKETNSEPEMDNEPEGTPKRLLSNAKRISESLGAQINPDLSWSSSLNTPSSLTPTFILSKRQESSSPVKATEEKTVFVRKLFPPVFKDDCLEPSDEDGLSIEESKEKKIDSSLDEDNGVSCMWRQKVLDAIEDGELRTAVESVLDGTEEILSFLFTSQNSCHQRMRTREGVMSRLKSQKTPQAPVATVHHKELNGHTESDWPLSDVTRPGEISNPVKKKDGEIIQWTPLSLSEFSGSNVEQGSLVESSLTNQHIPQHMEQFEHDYASQQKSQSDLRLDAPQMFVSTLDASSAPSLLGKPKKFMYSVRNSASLRQDVRKRFYKPLCKSPTMQCPDIPESGQSAESTQQQPGGQCREVRRSGAQVVPLTTFEKDEDMSQLCKAFAEDFSQEVVSSRSAVRCEKVEPVQSFSTSSTPETDRDAGNQPPNGQQTDPSSKANGSCFTEQHDVLPQPDVCNRHLLKLHQTGECQKLNHNSSTTSSGSYSDSEYEVSKGSQSQLFSGFKTASDKIISLPQEAVKRAKAFLDEFSEADITDSTAFLSKDGTGITKGSQGGRKNHVSLVPCSGQKNITLPSSKRISSQQNSTPHYPSNVSGFRTATDKRINISSLSLQKAKKMFKELEDEPSTDNLVGVQLKESGEKARAPKSALDAKGVSSLLVPSLNSADLLTASQKADVSELCSLLEDANSQCEFTQVKPSKVNSSKPQDSAQQTGEKDWDPDILTGINFNDSFGTDVAHPLSVQRSGITLKKVLPVSVENMSVSEMLSENLPFSVNHKTYLNVSEENLEALDHCDDLSRSHKNCAELLNKQNSTVRNPANCIDVDGAKVVSMTAEVLPKARNLQDKNSQSVSNRHNTSTVTQKVKFKSGKGYKALNNEVVCVSEEPHQEVVTLRNCAGSAVNSTCMETKPDAQLESNLMGCNRKKEKVNRNGDFSTAGGKSVLVSEKALLNARRILHNSAENSHSKSDEYLRDFTKSSVATSLGTQNSGSYTDRGKMLVPGKPTREVVDLFRDCGNSSTDQNYDGPEEMGHSSNTETSHSFGFRTASGKHVSVSSTALEKGKKLFDECVQPQGLEHLNGSTVEIPPVQSNSGQHSLGFSTASGKGISVSAESVQAAKVLLTDCDASSKINWITTKQASRNDPEKDYAGSQPDMNSEGLITKTALVISGDTSISEHSLSNPRVPHCGFSTASGKLVSVSNTAIQQAKLLFDEGLNPEDSKPRIDVALQHEEQMDLQDKGLGFHTASGKHVSVSSTALQKGKKLFDECVQPQGLEHLNGSTVEIPPVQSNTGQHSLGFSTASGKGISISAESVQAAKVLLTDCDTSSKINCITTKQASRSDPEKDYAGCQSAMKSEGLITKTALVISGDTSMTEHSLSNPRVPHCGFSTASGKLVSVSNTAIQQAKLLFDEGLKPEDSKPRIDVALQHEEQNDLQGRSLGFHTASGKHVSVSAKALKAAHAVFDDCSHIPLEIMQRSPTVNCGRKTDKCNTDPEGNNIWSPNIITETAQNKDTRSEEHSVINVGFNKASGKGVSVSKKALNESYKQLENCVENLPEKDSESKLRKTSIFSCKQWPEAPPDSERNQCNSFCPSELARKDSSGLSFQSDGLSSYTTTQQRYFEQEAMACTKALLEDENLHNDALHGTSGASQVNTHVEIRWSGKRDLANDSTDTNQPPLKRCLMAKSDKSSNRPLVPLKSSPNGILSDRTVRCNLPLQPNITQPHRTTVTPKKVNEEPELTTPESSHLRQSVERVPMFVPPFRKQTNPEHKEGDRSQAQRAPSNFVPPFKTKVNDPAAGSGGHTETHAKCSGFAPVIKKTCPQAEVCIQDPLNPTDLTLDNFLPSRDGNDFNHRVEHALNHKGPNTYVLSEGLEGPHTSEVSGCVQLAREMQDMRIRKKKRQTIKPLPGSLFLLKASGVARVSLRAAVGFSCPRRHPEEWLYMHGVPSEVCQVNSSSAKSFQFLWKHFFKWEVLGQAGGVQLADGGWLIPDQRGMLGKEQFNRALCDTPGVDPLLINEEWVYNHYRWIVWKRASMERAFPQELGGLCLTPEQVLLQLKYRYDVEIDRSQRSAIRRITERDDSPAKTLVLCVCGVETSGTACRTEGPVATIWLTDGWYELRALLDPPLTALLQKGRLSVGSKLVTHGAKLVGSQDACHPLEAPESLMLKISANSTRPARWDAKLGYHRDPRPIQLPLGTLFSDGGVVGCVDMLVLRSYPMQWMEKTAGGMFIFRNERAEEREARSYEQQKQKAMEGLFNNIRAQLEQEEEQGRKKGSQKRTLGRRELEALQDGEELYEAMGSDPTYLEADISKEQLASLCSFRRLLDDKRRVQLQERFRQALQDSPGCPNRDVTPVWKLAVCDCNCQQSSSSKASVFLLNIWRPSMELLSLLKEGGRYRAYHLSISEEKRKVTTAAIQLTATKKTHFEHLKVVPEVLQDCFQTRQCASFDSLQDPLFHPPCGEVDVVGYVIYITDRNGPSPVLYLVDERVDFVSVHCFSALRQLAVEELVKPLSLLIVSNALLRQRSAPVPALYAGDFTLFRTSSLEPHIQERMRQLNTFIQSQEHFFKGAEEKLSSLIPKHSSLTQSCPKTPGSTSDPWQNAVSKRPPFSGPITPVSKRAPSASTSEGRHPKILKRKMGFEYLSRIPSPPPLSPLGVVMPPSVKKTFNPPRRSESSCPMSSTLIPSPQVPHLSPSEDEWVKDEELALINTQNLLGGLVK